MKHAMKKYLLLFALLFPLHLFPVKSSKGSKRVRWRKRLIIGKSRKKGITEPLNPILKRSPKLLAPPWLKPPGQLISPPTNPPYRFLSEVLVLVPAAYPLGSTRPSHFILLRYLVSSPYLSPPKQLTLIGLKNSNQEKS